MTDAIVLTELGYIAELRGDATAARSLHLEALTAARTLGDHRALARALEGLAGAATLAGHHQRATRLLDRAAHTRALDGAPPSRTERSDIERIAAHARAAPAEANVTAPPDSS